MEIDTPFYQDDGSRTCSPVSISSRPKNSSSIKMQYDKSKLSLDFNSNAGVAGRKKTVATVGVPILTSPDLNLLKLASPDLERLIIQNYGNVTTTPTPTQFVFPKNVTQEQEQYAQGFVDALNKLHQTEKTDPLEDGSTHFALVANGDGQSVLSANGQILTTVSALPGSIIPSSIIPGTTLVTISTAPQITTETKPTFPINTSTIALNLSTKAVVPSQPQNNTTTTQQHVTTVVNNNNKAITSSSSSSSAGINGNAIPSTSFTIVRNARIKEEPAQTVPTMEMIQSAMSPINLQTQEKIKAERKRMRNRIAASKCRRRKLERISRLEDRVKDLKDQNSELSTTAADLKDQVCGLKQKVLEHVKSGCQVMLTQQLSSFV